ncbi:23636_t:CDS:2, partial [Racocetra persica]
VEIDIGMNKKQSERIKSKQTLTFQESLALAFTYSQESLALTIYVPIASKTFSVSISVKMFDENNDIFDEMYEESVSYKQPENSNNIFVSSSNKMSSIPNDQSPKKKVKLNKRRRRYAKISWVWRYFKLSDDEICVKCQVKTMNLRNKSVLCSCKLQYNGGT